MDQVYNFINNLNIENTTVVAAISGGPDSMLLLDILLSLREKLNIKIVVAHVHHNLRKESDEEAIQVEKFCKNNNLIFEMMKITEYPNNKFSEDIARKIRYEFFDEVVRKYESDILFTAHHGDDLIETVLMRLTRGSSLKGFAGFEAISTDRGYKIARPLIYLTKQEIMDILKEKDVWFATDFTNEKDDYTRNRYRKYILPFLKEEDKDVHLKFIKFSNLLSDANKFIDKERDKAIKRVMEEDKIIIDKFLLEDNYLQREILYYLLNSFYQDDLILINDKHIDLILKLINSKKANNVIDLPNEVIARKDYNYFSLEKEINDISSYEIEFDKYVELPNKHHIEKIKSTIDNSNNICRLNSKELSLPLIVRTRKVGDKIRVKGLNGSKKVKDIFIDKKIPLNDRDLWPIVVDSTGRIVWIPGVKKSIFDKKKSESYDIILKYS